MEIQDLRDTLQNCKRNTQHCDPRWGEQAFFSYSPEDKDHWQSLGIINPHADEHYFTLHLLDTEETVYWFLLMLYYQQIGLVQNAPTQIEYFSWNNQDQIKQLQLQQDIQSNNGPSKEYQHH